MYDHVHSMFPTSVLESLRNLKYTYLCTDRTTHLSLYIYVSTTSANMFKMLFISV